MSKHKILKLILNKDSITTGTSSNFIYYLPEPIFNTVSINLKNAIIENFIYNVSDKNNCLTLIQNNQVSFIKLTPGIYNNVLFLKLLSDFMPSLKITYDDQKRVVINSATSFNIEFNVPNSAYKLCGFIKQNYTSTNNTLTSDFSYNLSTQNIIFIQSQELDNNVILPNQIRVSNLLTLTSNNYGTSFNGRYELSENEINKDVNFKSPNLLNKISIRITDSDGEVLDLNGGTLVLVFDVVVLL